MADKTCGTCELAAEKYGDPTGGQLICRATAGHLRFGEDECDVYETDFETLCHKSKRETNWQRYFGTPEKAAETIDRITSCCYSRECSKCPLYYGDCATSKDIAEWLEGDAE